MYDRLLKYCESRNYKVTIYIDKIKNRLDVNNRIELMRLKTDVINKKYSTIVIDDLKHFSRDIFMVEELINFFKKYGCDIECVNGTNVYMSDKIFREEDIVEFENKGLGKCVLLDSNKEKDYSLIYSITGKQFIVAYAFTEQTKAWINGNYYSNLDDAYKSYQNLIKEEELER